ncbi:MAG: hypothetical protein QW767_01615 [Thermoprotei archaeon]
MKRSTLARIYVYLGIPLLIGVSLLAYASYTDTCPYPCGVIHPYRLPGEAVIAATIIAYIAVYAYSKNVRAKPAK